jgi:addiction module RelE/StbE family toxin
MPTIIIPSKQFTKHYKKRIIKQSQKQRFKKRVKIFKSDLSDTILRDHKLTGKLKGQRAFSITGDIRVIYKKINKDTVQFLDIGTHAQVYGE